MNSRLQKAVPFQAEEHLEKPVWDPQHAGKQIIADEFVIEGWQAQSSRKGTAKAVSFSENENQIEQENPQPIISVETPTAQINMDLAETELAPYKVEARHEVSSVGFSNGEMEAGTQSPVGTFSYPGADNGVEDISTETAGQNTPSPKVVSPQPEIHLEKPFGDSLSLEKQIHTNEFIAVTSQPVSEHPITSSYTVIDAEIEIAGTSAAAQAIPPTTINPDFDLPPTAASDPESDPLVLKLRAQKALQSATFQTGQDQESSDLHPNDTEKRSGTSASTLEVSQSDSDVLVAVSSSPITTADTVKNVRPQTAAQTTRPVTPDVSEVKSFQPEIDLEKRVIDTQSIERQFKADESMQAKSSASANLGMSEDVSFDAKAGLTIPVVNSEMVEKQVNATGSHTTVKAVEKNEVFTEEYPGQQDLRTDQTHLTDAKTHPVEKEVKPNEMLEPVSAATNAQKEFVAVGSSGKGRTFPVNLHAVEVVQRVIRQLNGRLQSGVTSMHVQLTPDVLGAIEVEMVRDAHGVSVTFFAEQASTGKLLETQLSQLRQSLVDSGVQLAGLNIGQQSHTGQEGGFQHQNMSFAQTPQRETFHREVRTQERPRAERMTGQTSEVDYLI
jgi:flagellar hook-length control protein FliK